jgi:hypothetical protein
MLKTFCIIFYEIVQGNPATRKEKEIVIAVLNRIAIGRLAPLNGMILAGIDDIQSNQEGIITLWE